MIAPAEALRDGGMTEVNAAACAEAFEIARREWDASSRTRRAARMLFVPGRIEVLGKHTDYAGGSTLTSALERGACVVYAPRDDNRLCLFDTLVRSRFECPLDRDLAVPQGHWSTYPATVARRLARNFGPGLSGADVALRSTLPMSAGLSSSSALVTATFLVLSAVNELPRRPLYVSHIASPVDLASYLGSVENGQAFASLAGDHGVGTFGGSEDHTAMLCSEPDRIGHFAFRPGRHLESLPMPAGFTFIIAASGVTATKTGNARERYNRASLVATAILQRWCEATGRADQTLQDAVASAPDAAEAVRDVLRRTPGGSYPATDLLRRFDHFVVENEVLLPAAVRALTEGDVAAFGAVSEQSQRAAEELLGNQVPETMALARLARELGAAAASAFGAGFGGSVWALVEEAAADAFTGAWRERYHRLVAPRVSARSVFLRSGAGPPAMHLP